MGRTTEASVITTTPCTAIVVLLAFSVPCGCIDLESDINKNRPVTKVITLLQDMLKQLEKEAETDEEIYDKMACWCETNEEEKDEDDEEDDEKEDVDREMGDVGS